MKKYITFCLMMLTMLSCSSVGWIKKDKKTNTGTFVYKDGSIYTGGYLDKKFSGNGRFVYGNNSYKSGGFTIYNDIPNVLTDCSYTGVFENGIIKQNSHIVFIRKASNSISRENFTYEGNYAHGGFEGKGILHFFDGLIVEGNFSNETTTFSSMYCCVYYYPKINWEDNNMIGSKISGQCKLTWPNGTVFTGTIYDYYLFNRANLGVDHFYPNREFIGVGILKVPGKKDYQGCFRENDDKTITPITEKDMISLISYFEKNTYSMALAKERNGQDVRESDNAKKGQEEEKKASDWLRNEMADLPKKFKIQQEEADAISRGTTVAAEKAKALRDAAFYEAEENRAKASAGNSNSESNTNSNTSNTNTGTASNGSNSSNANSNSGTKSQSSNSSKGTASNGTKSQSSNSSNGGTAANGSNSANGNSNSGNSSYSSTGNISPIVLHVEHSQAWYEEQKQIETQKQQEADRMNAEENKKNEQAKKDYDERLERERVKVVPACKGCVISK